MTLPFTDHHIQDKIIATLVNGEQRFSDLIPEQMENSLFMYHMRKLTKEGLVEKDDQMYRLTLKGAQFYNARYHLDKPLNYPRALIQFLVVKDDAILLSRRTTALADRLNEYMLPGGTHYFLAPSRTAASSIAKTRHLKPGAYLGSLETIAAKHNYHGLIDLYEAEYASSITSQQAEYELVWVPLEEVAVMDFYRAGSAPYIVQRVIDNTILPRMTWFADDITQSS
jgi:predicted transcriptional regulator